MPDTASNNQLPPRTTTSTNGSRKWATLGGRAASSSTTKIPTNDSDVNENLSKTNGHQRHSSSLFRKSSTISRTNGTPIPSDENSATSLKKSRSLINVLRSKFNSPAVLRRFRSKSRESTKQTVTEIDVHPINDQQPEIKQSNTEQTTRKSRKRDPSPMRRLANRISQLTRHPRTTSNERQKKSPSKSFTNDSHDEPRTSPSPLHNKDEVDHINACYDEILAKYSNKTKPNQQNPSNDDAQNRSLSTISVNGSLLSNDFFNNSQRIHSPLPSSDDPLLQARRQTNIKLNCMLSGYSLTTSFANHEKLFGQNDLFKFHHYYDVGKRKYDYNFTSTNNRIFSDMKTRPISKSIDSFRRQNRNENEGPVILMVDHDSLVQIETPRRLPDDNELVIREDNDLITTEHNTSQYSANIPEIAIVQPIANRTDEKKISSNVEEHDEEFERSFLRAVDRALGVVNKDENYLIQSNDENKPTDTDESHFNLMQMTERALSSFNNSPLFTNDDQTNEQIDNNTESEKIEVDGRSDEPLINEQLSKIDNDTELANTEVIDHTDQPLNNEELSKIDNDAPMANTEVVDHTDVPLNNDKLLQIDNDTQMVNTEVPLTNEEVSKIDNDTEVLSHVDEPLNNEELSKIDNDTELEKTEVVDHTDKALNNEDLLKVDNDTELANPEVLDHTDKPLNDEDLLKIDNDTLANPEVLDHTDKPLNDEDLLKVDNDTLANPEVLDHTDKPLNDGELLKVDNDTELADTKVVDHTDEHLNNVELSKIGNDTELATSAVVDHTNESLNTEEFSTVDTEKPTNDDLIDEDIRSIIDELILKVDELLFENSKNGQTFLVKLDEEEKTIKSKAEAYNKMLQTDDHRLTEDVRTDINAVVGEVNLLLRGKLKQFRGLCEANVTKSSSGQPIPLDSDLEGFWDITYPLTDKVKEKFAKLDARKAKQWAPIEEYDPNDVNNRPRVIDDRLKQLQPQQNKTSKIPITKSANDDLKKLIQERRKAAANATNQNHDIEIFVAPK